MTRDKKVEKEIDLLKLIIDLWARRKFIFIVSALGLVLGIIIAFGKPKEYVSEVKLAPERVLRDDVKLSTVGKLTSSIGLSNGYNSRDEDAINFSMYPDVVASFSFISELFSLDVIKNDEGENIDLYNYINANVKTPWWNNILGLFRGKGDVKYSAKQFNPECPNGKDYATYYALKSRVKLTLNQQSSIFHLKVQMQDPEVAYIVAKAVVDKLNEYINNYRQVKKENDYYYAEEIFSEAKYNYFAAKDTLEQYEKQQLGNRTSSCNAKYDFLKKDVDLKHEIYSGLLINLTESKLRLQQKELVCTVIETANRPQSPSSPNKPLIITFVTLVFFVLSSFFIVIKDKLI